MDEEQVRGLRSRLGMLTPGDANFDWVEWPGGWPEILSAYETQRDTAAALRVEAEELREAASAAVLAYGAHAHAQLRELFNESKSEDTLKALDALALAMSNLDIALQADPATQGEVQP